jgi:hypothetical protein
MSNYKILPPIIKRGSYHYYLMHRIGMIAIYEQRRPKTPDRACGYAVVRIRNQKPSKLPNGVILPHREVFPSPSEFGKTGWFYMKKSRAFAYAHFYELVGKYGDNIPPKKSFNPESEGTTHFEDEDDLNGGDGIVA